MEQLLHYDEQLFVFLNSLGNTAWDEFWLVVTHKLTFIPLYALLIFLIYRKWGIRATGIIILVAVLMITCTDQLSNLFKYGFERERPCRLAHLESVIRHVASRCGKYGFFSAHAASSMAAAVFSGLLLRKHYPYFIYGMLVWSALVSYSRIYVGVHYPTDIIVGIFFGGLIGWGAYRLSIALVSKKSTNKI